MLAILQAGLRQHGLDCETVDKPAAQERIPLASKQAFLATVRENHGLAALLRIGTGITAFTGTPIGQALLAGCDAPGLLRRWQRLERYLHSQHYLLCELAPCSARLSHVSRSGRPPSLDEDLAVLGVLGALLQRLTGSEVRLSSDAQGRKTVCRWPQLGIAADQLMQRADWHLHWQSNAAAPGNPACLACPASASTSGTVSQTRAAIAQLGLLDATLARVASLLAVSPRTLQRQLQDSASHFSAELQACRISEAGRLLLGGRLGLAEIGFVCGFADQAHFTRSFKNATGMAPGQYRALQSG